MGRATCNAVMRLLAGPPLATPLDESFSCLNQICGLGSCILLMYLSLEKHHWSTATVRLDQPFLRHADRLAEAPPPLLKQGRYKLCAFHLWSCLNTEAILAKSRMLSWFPGDNIGFLWRESHLGTT